LEDSEESIATTSYWKYQRN